MTIANLIAILVVLAAAFSYMNYRWLRLPTTVALMLMSVVLSLVSVLLELGGFGTRAFIQHVVSEINFTETLLHGMLSYLLFAGALHIDLSELAERRLVVGALSVIGVLISTVVIGVLTFYMLPLLGLHMDLLSCLLFGALISPTDPVAVLAIMKSAGAPKNLEIKIAGESLFNDGVGVVVFLTLLHMKTDAGATHISEVLQLLAQETIGGILFGLVAGWITYWLMKSVDNYQVEILLSLGLVTGGYALADSLHLSGPIAIVVAGLLIGNHGRRFAMSQRTRHNLDMFWELVDEILNAVLFVTIGLEILVVTLTRQYFLAGLAAIPIALAARFISVAVPITALRPLNTFSPHTIKILTWAGLRGGISIALALSLPQDAQREIILAMTYGVVLFTVITQGSTLGFLFRRSAG